MRRHVHVENLPAGAMERSKRYGLDKVQNYQSDLLRCDCTMERMGLHEQPFLGRCYACSLPSSRLRQRKL